MCPPVRFQPFLLAALLVRRSTSASLATTRRQTFTRAGDPHDRFVCAVPPRRRAGERSFFVLGRPAATSFENNCIAQTCLPRFTQPGAWGCRVFQLPRIRGRLVPKRGSVLCLEKLQTIRPRAALGGLLEDESRTKSLVLDPLPPLYPWCFASSRLARGFVASSPSDSTPFRRAGDMPARGFHAAFRLGERWACLACHACRDVNLAPRISCRCSLALLYQLFLAAMLQVRGAHAAVDLRL